MRSSLAAGLFAFGILARLSRIHAVGQASRLSLTSSESNPTPGRLVAGRVHLLVRYGSEDGDRRDACPTLWTAPVPTISTAWIRLRTIGNPFFVGFIVFPSATRVFPGMKFGCDLLGLAVMAQLPGELRLCCLRGSQRTGCLTVLGTMAPAERLFPGGQTGYSQPIPTAGIGGSPHFAARTPSGIFERVAL